MKETGAAFWLAEKALLYIGVFFQNENIGRWFITVVMTGILTNILSSAATLAVLGPIVLDMGGNPLVIGISASIASAFSYLTIVASPTCMIIHSTGLIRSRDYLKAGWKLFIMSVVLLMLISKYYWPLIQ